MLILGINIYLMKKLNTYYLKSLAILLISLFLFITSGCDLDSNTYSLFNNYFRSPEKCLLNSYADYIQTVSSTDFPLTTFRENSRLDKKPVYAQKIQSDHDLQFFPATLWQVYALNGKPEWKRLAENYSTPFYQDTISEKMSNGEVIQNVYLTPFLVTRDQSYKSSLLDVLSVYISKTEENGEINGDASIYGTIHIEKLLENQLLLLASKETGDPIYKQLAKNNSEYIFNHFFQNQHSNELYYGLVNWKTIPLIKEMEELGSRDFYNLALIFYGFTILDKQQDNEKYHLLCVKLAEVFTTIFSENDDENASTNIEKDKIIRKIDLLSQTFVSLALSKLRGGSENQYRETSERIFNRVLDKLDQTSTKNDEQQSFRMYYYLFEYLKQKEITS